MWTDKKQHNWWEMTWPNLIGVADEKLKQNWREEKKQEPAHPILFWMLVKRMTQSWSWQRQKSSELVRREYKCIFFCGFGIIIAPQTETYKPRKK